MNNSKFDTLYDNIISEQYHRNFGFWTAEKCGKKIMEMLSKRIKSEYLEDLNDTFVPKKWFDFKKKFKKIEPDTELINYSVTNCRILITFNVSLTPDEAKLLVYGEEKVDKDGVDKFLPLLEKKKPGGLYFNSEFRNSFDNLNFPDPTDNENKKIDINGLDFSIVFSFNKPTYVDGVKTSKRTNPNYIKSIKGSIFFVFDNKPETEIKVGTCEYFQSRYANMNPPKSLKSQIKDMWDKPASDFGLIGTLAAKGIGSAANAVFGGTFSSTVQEENFELTIDDKFNYSNNIIGGDIETRSEKGSDDIIETELYKFFDKLKEDTKLLEYEVKKSDKNAYRLVIKIDDSPIVALDMEIENG